MQNNWLNQKASWILRDLALENWQKILFSKIEFIKRVQVYSSKMFSIYWELQYHRIATILSNSSELLYVFHYFFIISILIFHNKNKTDFSNLAALVVAMMSTQIW